MPTKTKTATKARKSAARPKVGSAKSKPPAKKAAAKKTAAKKPSARKPAVKKPTTKKGGSKKPAAEGTSRTTAASKRKPVTRARIMRKAKDAVAAGLAAGIEAAVNTIADRAEPAGETDALTNKGRSSSRKR